MNARISCSPKYPANRWALRAYDALLVSAFGIWSVALGVTPVLIVQALVN
jgi:hypothetical protein